MFDLTLQQILFRLVALLIITGTHGFFIAALARVFGDRGPGYDGRFNVNPFNHMNGLGFLGFLFYLLGWLKPIGIDPKVLRPGRAGLVLIAIGALLLTLLLAFLFWEARQMVFLNTGTWGPTALNMITVFVDMSVWFVVLNIIPVPPLTGGYLLQAVSPAAYRLVLRRLYLPIVVLVVVIVTELAQPTLRPLHDALARALGFDAIAPN